MKTLKISIFISIFCLLGGVVIGSAEPYHDTTTDLEIQYNALVNEIGVPKTEYRAKMTKLRVFKKKVDAIRSETKEADVLNKTHMLDTVINEKIVDYRQKILGNARRIAHAGGVYKGRTYTNSLDALNANRDFYQYFELDFSWTSDGHLVCIHDWGGAYKNTFGIDPKGNVPTLAKFEERVANNKKFHNCTLETLVSWLDLNPNTTIITDVKEGNVAALHYIATKYPSYKDRFIPQIYEPAEYSSVRKDGFKKIIWTLYKYAGNSSDVMRNIKNMNLFAITMDTGRAAKGLGKILDKQSIYSYVHTVNTDKDLIHYNSLGVDEVYTDTMKL